MQIYHLATLLCIKYGECIVSWKYIGKLMDETFSRFHTIAFELCLEYWSRHLFMFGFLKADRSVTFWRILCVLWLLLSRLDCRYINYVWKDRNVENIAAPCFAQTDFNSGGFILAIRLESLKVTR
jgi:hypothetical protein